MIILIAISKASQGLNADGVDSDAAGGCESKEGALSVSKGYDGIHDAPDDQTHLKASM